LLNRIEIIAALLGIATAVLWALVADLGAASSVLVGAGIGVANFMVLRQLVAKLVLSAEGASQGQALLMLGLKMVALVGVLVALLVGVGLDPIGFGVGASAIVVSLIFESLRYGTTSIGFNEAPPSTTPEGLT